MINMTFVGLQHIAVADIIMIGGTSVSQEKDRGQSKRSSFSSQIAGKNSMTVTGTIITAGETDTERRVIEVGTLTIATQALPMRTFHMVNCPAQALMPNLLQR